MAEDDKDKPEKVVSREERLERIRKLLVDRGEDAARVVKTWLNQDPGRPRR